MDTPITVLPNDVQATIARITGEIEQHLIAVRRDLHAHPELAFEEVRTAGVVANELTRMGIAHETGIAQTGVVGIINGGRPGPVLAIRADMDALPIQERTDLPWASTKPGLMHACGHDIHTTTLLGVADVLHKIAPSLAGTVKLIFQPAEEAIGGAEQMIEAGVLEGPKVDMAIGFHNYPHIPVGEFSFCPGPALAAADMFTIEVHGKSGHAAHPYAAIDPIVAAATLITQLQTVVSREMRPLHPAVVTVGAINGGIAHNIIPDSVVIKGTVRTLHKEAQDIAERAIQRMCDGAEIAMRTRCTLTYERGVPAMLNDDRVLEPVVEAVRKQLGDVIHRREPSMGAEDFALMSQMVPAFQLGIGSGAPGRADRLHNSGYAPDEACIGLGVQALARAAVEILA
ncbi:MAG: M20 family metallopeptidase [Acetobacteraceae bacterium]|nr:M20 family metallopeptidase [Acetobacteraceae bacterium]